MAMTTAQQVYNCREAAAELFGIADPSRVIFTPNCTMALNIVIKGILSGGGHAVVSDMEHNSVIRPLEAMAQFGVSYNTAAVCEADPARTVENFRRCIRPSTRLILCTHASNVFGTVLPIREIGKMAHDHGIPFAVDAAQSAGILSIHMERDHIDFLCTPGHKGLYGPMGTGMLICHGKQSLTTLVEGGTGSRSLLAAQPEELPDRFESGTLNVPGICGLHAGMAWIRRQGISSVALHEMNLMQRLYDLVCEDERIMVYTKRPEMGASVPVLSLNIVGMSSEETASRLSAQGVAVRAGLHCAPSAHTHAHTLPGGTVRLAPSVFTRRADVENVYKILIIIARKP
jgi:cysteine desulfurase family protein